jgi:hypothetical protein
MLRRDPALTLVQAGPLIRLLLDGEVQGVVDAQGIADLLPAASTLTGAALCARPGATRALVVGVGLGSDVRRLRAQGVRTQAVEIDARVARLARRFGVGEVVVGDGRAAWKASLERGERFDLVLLDACTGPGLLPRHLWTGRAVAELAALVAPRRGAVVVRVIARPNDRFKEAIERAFRRSFEQASWQAEALSPGGNEGIVTFSDPAPDRRALARPALNALVVAGLTALGCSAPPPTAKPPLEVHQPDAPLPSAPVASAAIAVKSDAEGQCPTLPSRLEPPKVAPAPDGRPGVRVVGFLLQQGNELLLERLSNETVTTGASSAATAARAPGTRREAPGPTTSTAWPGAR